MAWFSRELLAGSELPWIAVRTRVRSEKSVANVLSHWGAECWAPTAAVRNRWSDRWKVVQWPLFPGYLFARIPADGWYPLLDISGVHTVVKDGRRAAVIDLATLTDIRGFADALGRADGKPEYIPWFEVGDLVMVSEGSFAGVRAEVTEVEGRKRVAIGLTILGRGVSVTIPATKLVRIPA